MVADTLDAMTTDRPYRQAVPYERVLDEVRKYSGRQFDPRLAKILLDSVALRTHVVRESQATAPIALPVLDRPPTRPQRVVV